MKNVLNTFLRGVIVTGLFIVPFIPLYIANPLFFPFITGKGFAFRIIVEIVFVAWIILFLRDKSVAPRLSWLTGAVTIFAVIVLLADLFGANPLRSIWSNFERMEGWLVIAHLWAYFLVLCSYFTTREWWHRFLNTTLIAALIVAFYGFAQYMGWAVTHQGGRLDASLGNAAYMGGYMLINVFLAIYMAFVSGERRKGWVWAYSILALFFAFICFNTGTRGSIVGLVGGGVLFLVLLASLGWKQGRQRNIAAGILGVMVIVLALFYFNRDRGFIQSHPVLGRLAQISWNETKTQARAFIWPMAIKGSMEKPVLGWGQENFNYIFNKDYDPRLWSHEQWFDRAHNVYLDWLVAGGILGLLSYLALYVLFLLVVWKSTSLTLAQKSALTALLAGYAVHNVFVFDNLTSYILFFMLLGFAAAQEPGRNVPGLSNEPVRHDVVEYIIAPAMVILLAAGIYFVNVRPISANTKLISALRACNSGKPDVELFNKALEVDSKLANQEIREQILYCAGSVLAGPYAGNAKQAFFELAQRSINEQIAFAPEDARMYVLGGFMMNNIGQAALAQGLLEKAHELTPKKQSVSIQLANVYLNVGKQEEAIQLLKEAYEADTTHTEAKIAYITGLVAAGKEAEARSLFSGDEELFESDRLASAYVAAKQYAKAISIYQKQVAADPKNVNLRAKLAQTQFFAGMKSQAIETLRGILVTNPEYKVQIEAAIKEIQEAP